MDLLSKRSRIIAMFEQMFAEEASGGSRRGPGGGNFHFSGGGFPGGGGFGGGHGGGRARPPPDLFPKETSKVARLGKPKFPNASSKHLWLIMFYSSDSREAHDAAAVLEKLAAKTTLAYKVGAVDCRKTEREHQFCIEKGVDDESLPQFAMVVDGEVKFYDDGDYAVTTKGLHEFCQSHMPQHLIHNVNNAPQLEERLFLKEGEQPAVLLLTDKYETSSLYYSLAYQFRTDFVFGESRAKNLKLAQQFGVKKYPQLIVFVPASGSRQMAGEEKFNDHVNMIRYNGDLDKDSITKWLEQVAAKRKTSSSSSRKSR